MSSLTLLRIFLQFANLVCFDKLFEIRVLILIKFWLDIPETAKQTFLWMDGLLHIIKIL